jgi:antitoxin component YwqK of YwqJK toxin-antitoxin module
MIVYTIGKLYPKYNIGLITLELDSKSIKSVSKYIFDKNNAMYQIKKGNDVKIIKIVDSKNNEYIKIMLPNKNSKLVGYDLYEIINDFDNESFYIYITPTRALANYIEKKFTGCCTQYYTDGLVQCKIEYINGKANGFEKYWIINYLIDNNNKRTYKSVLVSETWYKNNIKNGPEKKWYTNGKIKSECVYVNGQMLDDKQ